MPSGLVPLRLSAEKYGMTRWVALPIMKQNNSQPGHPKDLISEFGTSCLSLALAVHSEVDNSSKEDLIGLD